MQNLKQTSLDQEKPFYQVEEEQKEMANSNKEIHNKLLLGALFTSRGQPTALLKNKIHRFTCFPWVQVQEVVTSIVKLITDKDIYNTHQDQILTRIKNYWCLQTDQTRAKQYNMTGPEQKYYRKGLSILHRYYSKHSGKPMKQITFSELVNFIIKNQSFIHEEEALKHRLAICHERNYLKKKHDQRCRYSEILVEYDEDINPQELNNYLGCNTPLVILNPVILKDQESELELKTQDHSTTKMAVYPELNSLELQVTIKQEQHEADYATDEDQVNKARRYLMNDLITTIDTYVEQRRNNFRNINYSFMFNRVRARDQETEEEAQQPPLSQNREDLRRLRRDFN